MKKQAILGELVLNGHKCTVMCKNGLYGGKYSLTGTFCPTISTGVVFSI